MTKSQLIAEINALRRPGDPLIPGTKKGIEARLVELRKRQEELLDKPKGAAR